MANWNLSVELRGQGSSLENSLRDAAREASTLSRNVRRAQRRLDDLRDSAQDAATALDGLQRSTARAASEFGDLRTQALEATASLRSLNTAVGRADGRLERVSDRARTLSSDLRELDTAAHGAGGSLGGLQGNLGGLNHSSQQASAGADDLKSALYTMASAALPVATAFAPLVGNLAAAGVGFGAFTAALAGQIGDLNDAAEAQTKYDEAVRDNGKGSKEAAEAAAALQRQIASMPPATQEAAAAVSSLRAQYDDWSDSMASSTMPVFTKGVQLLSASLPRLSPLVKGAAKELERLTNVTAGAMVSPEFDSLMDRLTTASNSTLHEIVTDIINLGEAAARFGQSDDFDAFMDAAHELGPVVAETLKNLGRALMNLVAGSSDAGVTMLNIANALAKLVAALPPEFIGILIQGYTAFKLFAAGAAAVTAVTGSAAATNLAAFVRSARFGGVASAAGGVAQGMGAMSKGVGIAALAFAAFYAGQKIGETFWSQTPVSAEHVTKALIEMGQAGRIAAPDLKTLTDSAARLNQASIADTIYDYGTFHSNQEWKKASGDFAAWDTQLTKLVSSGNMKEAKNSFGQISTALKKQGLSGKEIADLFPQYKQAVADVKQEAKLTADGMGVFGDQASKTSAKLTEQKASADGLRQSLVALNDVNRQGLSAMSDFEAAIDNLGKTSAKGTLSMKGGQINLDSEGARTMEKALRDMAAATDAVVTSQLDAGASWETVNGLYTKGRDTLIKQADAWGLSKSQAKAYADSVLQIPTKHSTLIEMQSADAAAGLDEVIKKIRDTPNAKSVTVHALTKEAVAALERAGYKVKTLPNGKMKVTALTGTAISNLAALLRLRDSYRDKSATFTVTKRTIFETVRRQGGSGQAAKNFAETSANGNLYKGVQHYADGGMRRENHVAQFARAGTWRVWAEDETGGEAYIPLARSKRPRSRAIAEETVRRLGGGPVQWYADGGLDFSYRSTGAQASKYTLSGLISGSNDKKGNFSLSKFTSKLRASNNALAAWRRDLSIVASRAGQDVADALAEMGDEGIALTKKMAHGSSKYVKGMAKELEKLSAAAKASLGEYTSQLKEAVKDQSAFQADLAKLAGMGYGDLAGRLAGQNDADAAALAHQAAKDPKKAASANSAASAANKTLDGEQLAQLVQIIAAVKSKSTGIHDVAAATGLGEDDIIAVATKAKSQIASSLGGRADRFLADLGRAQKGLAYENGGIRAGIYATRAGLVRFAEPSTGGEAYIPLGANKRRGAMNVLGDVAGRFGVGLTDAASSRVVIVREKAPMVGQTHFHIGDRQSDRDLARDIESRQTYQLRRLARGGAR